MSRAEDFNRYAELCEWIRELSAPQIEGIPSPAEFRKRFERSFARINELIRTCKHILDASLFPLLNTDRLLTAEEVDDLLLLMEKLVDATNLECVDVPLRSHVTDRLLADAERKGDTVLLLRTLDAQVENAYFMMNTVQCLAEARDLFTTYRDQGLRAAKRILEFLEPERFAALPYEMKEIVLVNSRYMNGLYDSALHPVPRELLQENLDVMKRSLALAKDPFYIDQASKYNWKTHTYRALQGIAFMTDYMNDAGVPEDMLQEVSHYTRQMVALWKREKINRGALCAPETLYECMYRNAFLAGEIPLYRFREEMLHLIDGADHEDFTHDGNMRIIFSQTEYLLTLDKDHLTVEEKKNVTRFYRDLVYYVHRMPKVGSLTFLLAYLSQALSAFIEFEGGPDISELMLELLAAIQPQVYLHSLGTAEIAGVLTRRLFAKSPERFAGVPGYPDGEAIAALAHRAGLLHDIGKLMITERVLTYGRSRFDEEQEIYATGPEIGAVMLSRFESTKLYAGLVRAHHFDYDRKDFFARLYADDAADRDLLAVAHILRLSNDMQWMTRKLRFSETPLMDYEAFCERARERSGTQYAPEVVALLDEEETRETLRDILTEDQQYDRIYALLKEASTRAV